MRIAEGESLRSVCRDPKMPSIRTVIRWLMKGEPADFCHHYARAREVQAETFADDLMEIADDGRNDWMEIHDNGECIGYKVNGEAVARSKLRADTRKWVAERMLPKKYGTKVGLEHGVTGTLEEFLRDVSGSQRGSPMGRLADKRRSDDSGNQ